MEGCGFGALVPGMNALRSPAPRLRHEPDFVECRVLEVESTIVDRCFQSPIVEDERSEIAEDTTYDQEPEPGSPLRVFSAPDRLADLFFFATQEITKDVRARVTQCPLGLDATTGNVATVTEM
jgi:hypothetical protein